MVNGSLRFSCGLVTLKMSSGRRDPMVVNLQLHVQSVALTTKVVSLNLGHGKLYSIQHYQQYFSYIWRWSVLLVDKTGLPGDKF